MTPKPRQERERSAEDPRSERNGRPERLRALTDRYRASSIAEPRVSGAGWEEFPRRAS